MIAQIAVKSLTSTDVICTPSGWTSVVRNNKDSNISSQVFYRVATDSEPASYTWRFRENQSSCSSETSGRIDRAALGGMTAFSGVDTANPIAAFGANTNSGTTLTAPAVTAPQDTRVLRLYAIDKNSAIPTPAGTTLSYANQQSTEERAFLASSTSQASAGSTGTTAVTVSSGPNWVAQTIALTAAPTSPSKLAYINSATSGLVNDCLGPITVQTQTSGNVAINPEADTEVEIATDAAGDFFSDETCETALTVEDRTIAASGNAFSFYYQPTSGTSASHELTASAAGLTAATQVQTVGKLSQDALSVTEPAEATYGQFYAMSASGGSGTGEVTFAVVPGSTACAIVESGDNAGMLEILAGTGTCTITATKAADDIYDSVTSAEFEITIEPASQTITFTSTTPSNAVVGDTYQPTATGGDSGNEIVFGASGDCTFDSETGMVTLTGTGDCTVTADQDSDSNFSAAPQVTQVFAAGKATIEVTLENLLHTYDGTPKAATASTDPSGLEVTITYDGSETVPTDAGSYAVVATINDSNYQGSASGTLIINQADAIVTLGDLDHTYDGTAKGASVTTDPSGLDVTITYAGSATAPTNAGSYAVVATISDPNYVGSTEGTLTIGKAAATISLSNLSHTYNGSAKAATVTTDLSGLSAVTVTYNGSATAPTNAGSYAVVAKLTNANYAAADATGTLVIAKASQTITFGALASKTYGNAPFNVSASSTSGLTVSFTAAGSCTVAGTTVTISGAGSCTVQAAQAGNGNVNAATPVARTFTIAKAVLTVKAANKTMTAGDALPAFTSTFSGFVGSDAVAVVNGSVTYATSPTASSASPAGTYTIIPNVSGLRATNYAFTAATGTLTIAAKSTDGGGTPDTDAPVLTLPANITATATGPDGAAVSFGVSATDAVDGAVAVVCTPASGSVFHLGTTTVTCTAEDAAGNVAAGTFTVTIEPYCTTEQDAFWRTWARTDKPVLDDAVDRTWIWSPEARTLVCYEPYAESPDGWRMVQYYDKSRMEINDPHAVDDGLWYVTNGLLVRELITGQLQVGDTTFVTMTPSTQNVAGDPGAGNGPTYAVFGALLDLAPLAQDALIIQRIDQDGNITIDESLAAYGVTAAFHVEVPGIDHRVASVFWDYMHTSGPVHVNGALGDDQLFANPFYATGLPITEAFWTSVKVAGTEQLVLVQCFERRCLTYTPGNEAAWRVEMGNVGRHYYEWRYQKLLP